MSFTNDLPPVYGSFTKSWGSLPDTTESVVNPIPKLWDICRLFLLMVHLPWYLPQTPISTCIGPMIETITLLAEKRTPLAIPDIIEPAKPLSLYMYIYIYNIYI